MNVRDKGDNVGST